MIRTCKVLGIALLLSIPLSILAADTGGYPKVGKSWTVTFTEPAKVGSALLPAGEYRVSAPDRQDVTVRVPDQAEVVLKRPPDDGEH